MASKRRKGMTSNQLNFVQMNTQSRDRLEAGLELRTNMNFIVSFSVEIVFR